MAAPAPLRFGTISVQYIQISDTSVMPHNNMNTLLLTPVEIDQRAEHDRQDETAETADQSDDAGHGADVLRVLVGDVLEHRGLAEREGRRR